MVAVSLKKKKKKQKKQPSTLYTHNNQLLKYIESTPTHDNKLQPNIENNSKNISESKHQLSNSPRNQENPDSKSELTHSQLKTTQRQNSITGNKLQPELEPSLKTSSETTPELNPLNNQVEKQDIVESTPIIENISENKHQPSDSPPNKEIPENNSELTHIQLQQTSEITQTPLTKDDINSNQTQVFSQPSLENHIDIQPRQTTTQTNIQKSTSTKETPSDDTEDSLFQTISLSNTYDDIPQTVQKNTENLPNKPEESNYLQLSPLIQQSDLQLSKFVNDFSNLSNTFSQNSLQDRKSVV